MTGSCRRIKRSNCLVFFFEQGRIHCCNYLTDTQVESSPVLVALLAMLDRWRTPAEIERLLSGYSSASIQRTLHELKANTLVVEHGSEQAKRESELAPWDVWGVEARFFHFVTRNAYRGAPAVLDDASIDLALARSSPQPGQIKKYAGARQFLLPDITSRLDSEFPRVLLARRTHRCFAAGRLPLEKFSALVRLTWGITGKLRWPGLGKLPVKTSPSGGARNPLEAYVWALRVEGLPRGLYHYRADVNRLELMRRGASVARIARLCAGQEWIRNCAALFLMTAVLPRTMWRYRFSRAYRVVLLEAGHFCQTFCLAATWLGLAPFCTAALLDEEIEKELGLGGATECVLYAAGVGLQDDRLQAAAVRTNRRLNATPRRA
ncbi:MAG: SagB/ThcOx family dehydrogenase [Acidobacteriota bacterium]|nr:SagB/ThcOx family dehydrogenase [Acidobacteriota bacterium]